MTDTIDDRLKEFVIERKHEMCPLLYKGSPCENPTDNFWAMGCPNDYLECSRYQQLKNNN